MTRETEARGEVRLTPPVVPREHEARDRPEKNGTYKRVGSQIIVLQSNNSNLPVFSSSRLDSLRQRTLHAQLLLLSLACRILHYRPVFVHPSPFGTSFLAMVVVCPMLLRSDDSRRDGRTTSLLHPQRTVPLRYDRYFYEVGFGEGRMYCLRDVCFSAPFLPVLFLFPGVSAVLPRT